VVARHTSSAGDHDGGLRRHRRKKATAPIVMPGTAVFVVLGFVSLD
jgi:hypothetical protein